MLAGTLFRIDHIVVEEFALPVENRNFAARAEAGINGHRHLASQGGSQKQLPQILRKDPDRLLVGLLFEKHPGLRLHRESQEAFIRILDGEADLLRCGRISPHELRDQDRDRLVFRRGEARKKKPLRLATADGENPMRRSLVGGFTPVEVILEFRTLLFLAEGDFGFNHALREI